MSEKKNGIVWHDLKENPKDLPDKEGTVLVSLNGIVDVKRAYLHAVDSAYYIEQGDGCDEHHFDLYPDSVVEAWAEAPTFKDPTAEEMREFLDAVETIIDHNTADCLSD